MSVLEFFDILETVYDGCCKCIHNEKHENSIRNLKNKTRRISKNNRLSAGGQENSLKKRKRREKRERCFRRYNSETSGPTSSIHSLSEFQAITDYSLSYHRQAMLKAPVPVGNNRSIGLLPLPNLYSQNPIRSASGYLPQKQLRLIELRQQGLRENIRLAFQKQFLKLRQRIIPSVQNLNIQQRFLQRIYNFIHQFRMVSNSAEFAMLNNGHSPKYCNTSAAMHVIDIDQIRQRLNNAIIDYLLMDDNVLVTP